MKRNGHNLVLRLARYTLERFPPYSHALYAAIVTGATISVASLKIISVRSGVAFCVATALLLALRLLDDVKDSESDASVYPDRPIPRGLLSHSEALGAAISAVAVSIVAGFAVSPTSLAATLVFAFYAGLMYVSFFSHRRIEEHVPVFVVSHTAVAIPLVLALNSILSDTPFFRADASILIFAIIVWSASATYDFSRKLLLPEEIGYEHSYSRRIGVQGALSLALASLITAGAFCVFLGVILELGSTYFIAVGIGHSAALISGTTAYFRPKTVRLFRLLASSENIVPFAIILVALA